ncbi:hypothetical protein bas19_0022 [Escherichia phage ChristophMerian]|nr:hypothetical protein bas19_0022 [Escherichia phage ChristophMerian]
MEIFPMSDMTLIPSGLGGGFGGEAGAADVGGGICGLIGYPEICF